MEYIVNGNSFKLSCLLTCISGREIAEYPGYVTGRRGTGAESFREIGKAGPVIRFPHTSNIIIAPVDSEIEESGEWLIAEGLPIFEPFVPPGEMFPKEVI